MVTAGQGEYYSLVYSEQAMRARSGVQPGGPDGPAEPPSGSEESQSQTTATPLPLQESGESGGSFGDPPPPPNHRQNENGGGSSGSRTEPDSSVAMTDLEKEIWENVKGEGSKH